MPDAAIGADVMVGFPGETGEDFELTRELIARLPFTYLHVFTYSSRPGTPSAAMPNQVPVHVARERNRVLRDLAAEKNRLFRQTFIGRQLTAVTLPRFDGIFTEALSDNYLKVMVAGYYPQNQFVAVVVDSLTHDWLEGHFLLR